MLALGSLHGIGILLLVPLLQLAGIGAADGSAAGAGHRIAELYRGLGLPPSLAAVLAIFLGLMVAREGLLRFQTVFNTELQSDFVLALRQRLYAAIARANWLFFTRARSSDFVQALITDLNRIGGGTHHLVQLASTGLLLAVHLLLALWVAPLATAATAACGLLALLLLRGLLHRAHGSGQQETLNAKAVFAAVAEHLGGMKIAKSFAAERAHIGHFARLAGAWRATSVEFARTSAGAKMWFSLGSAALFCAFLYAAVEVFAVPALDLLLLLLLYARMMPQVAALQQSYQLLAHMLPAFASYRELLADCTAAAESPEQAAPARPLEQEIRFDRVYFGYGPEREVLSAVELALPARRTTALVGPSGAGKSTLADLALGLLWPDRGRILVDGRPLQAGDLPSWRRGIGYVPQETFLFHDTVRANLSWAHPQAGEDEIWAALERAAADFVRDLPRGLDTEIGERGVRLSGGERQRLALARALLIRPKLLILDEATSHLDAENEGRIQQALDDLRGQLTLLVIAHRLSTVRRADQIAVMEGGRVVECGTWEALHQRRDSRLRALSRAQALPLGDDDERLG